MVDDPLSDLLGELLEAHVRLQQAGLLAPGTAAPVPRRSAVRAPRRRPSRAATVLAGVLALTASAAAAVVIATRASAPLAGRLPELLGSRYTLRVSPNLRAGRAGWCIALLERAAGRWSLPTGEQCVGGSRPLITRGGLVSLSPASGRVGAWLLWAIVDREVAALRTPSGLRIRPIASSALPSAWRAAVTIERHPPIAGGRSTVVTLTPLDSAGRPLPTGTLPSASLPTRSVSPARPGTAACRVQLRPGSAARPLRARALVAPMPGSLPDTGLLACYSVTADLAGGTASIALLVDAHHPGSRPVPIPGVLPLPGAPGIWAGSDFPDLQTGALDRLYARRAGQAWLVLETGAPPSGAIALLRKISASAPGRHA